MRGIERTHPVEIFTSNHDLLMEQALEDSRVPDAKPDRKTSDLLARGVPCQPWPLTWMALCTVA